MGFSSIHFVIFGTNKGTTSYTYDNLNSLKTVTEPNANVTTYTNDAEGNRATETVTNGANTVSETQYNYNEQNRLQNTVKTIGSTTETTTYTYDNNGNQIYSGTETQAPTVANTTENVSISVAGQGGTTAPKTFAIYEYNGFNQLVLAKQNGDTTEYTYNGDG